MNAWLAGRKDLTVIRRFCDVCGVEVTDDNSPCAGQNGGRVACEVKGKTGTLKVEVQHAIDGKWNSGDVCKYCIIDAVSGADDRPLPDNA